jgi:hypothetical protein
MSDKIVTDGTPHPPKQSKNRPDSLDRKIAAVRPGMSMLWKTVCDDRHVGLNGDEREVIRSAHDGGR